MTLAALVGVVSLVALAFVVSAAIDWASGKSAAWNIGLAASILIGLAIVLLGVVRFVEASLGW
jgi:hypothetical protein